MKKVVIIGCVLLMAGVPVAAHAGRWSDFVTVSTADEVVVSYRQREQKDGWFIEWKVENNSANWVEPFAKFRTYRCEDGSTATLDKKTLGPYPPGDQMKGSIRDRGICLGSQMGAVEVEIELRPVSEKVRSMWR